MAHYFETLDELGRFANAHRFTVDPGMSLFDLSLGGEHGARYFEQQPALRRVTGFIARQVGSVNLNLYSWDKGGDRERQYPPDHPAAAFLENPADPEKQPGVTAMALKEQLLLDALIHDKYCALIRYDDRTGLPKSMVRLPASRVRFKGAAGVVHGATYHREDGQTVELDLSVLFFSVGYTPHTGANGVPQIKTLRALLDGDSEALEYRTKMLREAVRAPGLLKHPGVLDDKVYERVRSSWREYAATGSKAGQEPILEDGLTYEQLKPLTNEDVADLEGRKLTDVEVATMYWIYPELLGLREGTNSNMQALKQALWSICLSPYVEAWQQSWDQLIRTQFRTQNRYVEADVQKKLEGDFKDESEVMARAVGGPFMSVNEARQKRNLPSAGPEYDKVIVPMNVTQGGKSSPMDGE